ncbi:MAG: nicotinate-nucleotide--dimethylbenzimidazole phosphoribosyltransferase [Eubacteriales bacterium]|nr:nicotinate-nucleotide--dimethylbenzimidazole phosphoribosyltransferase [Eubacteriales bacterium]
MRSDYSEINRKGLGITPVIYAGMRMGEGIGAVCLLPLLDMAQALHNGSSAFSSAGVKQYEDLGGDRQ